jgi:hypothetical protein
MGKERIRLLIAFIKSLDGAKMFSSGFVDDTIRYLLEVKPKSPLEAR